MASSQVEIASNSAFSYVLKERNRCSNSFQKNFKDLVSSCISGHSRSSGPGFIDYTDLWVHNPQTEGNENEGSGNNSKTSSARSDGNDNPDDFKDLWVHNPQQRNCENGTKKTTASKKWDSARNMVFCPERKKQESSESPKSHSFSRAVPIPNPHKGAVAPDRDGSASASVATSQRGNNWEVVSSKLLPRKVQHSPTHSECSRGVSSLVRKWRDFEAEAKSPVCTSAKGISVFCSGENEPLADASGRGSDCCDESVDLRPSTPTKNEDLFFDWESDQTGSCKGRDSDATEKEKIRVADIIKKLTSNGGESQNDRESSMSNDSALPLVRTSVDKSEVRPFCPVSSSPHLRGRHAFADLLMQLERDRHKELEGLASRKPVSKFSHRGRIQATLRVRFLRRGAEGKDGWPPIPAPPECTKTSQSAVLHIRQKYKETNSGNQEKKEVVAKASPRVEKVSLLSQQTKENHRKGLTEPPKPLNDVIENKLDAQKAVRNQEGFNPQEPDTIRQPNDRQQQESQTSQQEETSASGAIQQETKSEFCHHAKVEVTMRETSVKNITAGAENIESEESKNQKLMESSNEFQSMTDEAQVVEMENEEDHHSFIVCDYGQETDSFGGEWDEQQDEQPEEPNQDWICDVSRPRSAWEDLRQARYQEMLDPFMEKGDIKDLLNRRSVSSFLSSGLRENIDRLMMSRAEQSPRRSVSRVTQEERRDQVEEAQSSEVQEEQENFTQVHQEEDKNQSKGGYEYENYKEDEIHSNQEFMESHHAVQETSWGNSQDHYYAASSLPSPRESHAFDFSSPDTQPSSTFTDHPSIEMQFMHEMRGNMEQLHQEITKLRRSVKSCISMQTKLQKFIGQEAKSSSCHSGRKKRKDSSASKKSSRGRCCICYEMQIDSLLYRCGHMCTCFKCAKDLHWSSGKCPICQAQIIDVVRAYAYS